MICGTRNLELESALSQILYGFAGRPKFGPAHSVACRSHGSVTYCGFVAPFILVFGVAAIIFCNTATHRPSNRVANTPTMLNTETFRNSAAMTNYSLQASAQFY
jgi:hypothetical protein